MSRKAAIRGIGALAALTTGLAAAFGIGHAGAAVISTMPDTSFATVPDTIHFGTGSYTFTGIPGVPLGNPPAEVSTGGLAEVSSFFGGVADFGAGAQIDQTGELYTFSSFPTPTVIPNSAADDFIGLAFPLADGLHYGYAQVAGTTLVSYAYESTPGAGILTGAVPEPGTMLLLGAGLTGLAVVRRRRSGPLAANPDAEALATGAGG